MIESEVYALACAIGKCFEGDEPDAECISIARELITHLRGNGFDVARVEK